MCCIMKYGSLVSNWKNMLSMNEGIYYLNFLSMFILLQFVPWLYTLQYPWALAAEIALCQSQYALLLQWERNTAPESETKGIWTIDCRIKSLQRVTCNFCWPYMVHTSFKALWFNVSYLKHIKLHLVWWQQLSQNNPFVLRLLKISNSNVQPGASFSGLSLFL